MNDYVMYILCYSFQNNVYLTLKKTIKLFFFLKVGFVLNNLIVLFIIFFYFLNKLYQASESLLVVFSGFLRYILANSFFVDNILFYQSCAKFIIVLWNNILR